MLKAMMIAGAKGNISKAVDEAVVLFNELNLSEEETKEHVDEAVELGLMSKEEVKQKCVELLEKLADEAKKCIAKENVNE